MTNLLPCTSCTEHRHTAVRIPLQVRAYTKCTHLIRVDDDGKFVRRLRAGLVDDLCERLCAGLGHGGRCVWWLWWCGKCGGGRGESVVCGIIDRLARRYMKAGRAVTSSPDSVGCASTPDSSLTWPSSTSQSMASTGSGSHVGLCTALSARPSGPNQYIAHRPRDYPWLFLVSLITKNSSVTVMHTLIIRLGVCTC